MMSGWVPLGVGHDLKVPLLVLANLVPMHRHVLVAIGAILLMIEAWREKRC